MATKDMLYQVLSKHNALPEKDDLSLVRRSIASNVRRDSIPRNTGGAVERSTIGPKAEESISLPLPGQQLDGSKRRSSRVFFAESDNPPPVVNSVNHTEVNGPPSVQRQIQSTNNVQQIGAPVAVKLSTQAVGGQQAPNAVDASNAADSMIMAASTPASIPFVINHGSFSPQIGSTTPIPSDYGMSMAGNSTALRSSGRQSPYSSSNNQHHKTLSSSSKTKTSTSKDKNRAKNEESGSEGIVRLAGSAVSPEIAKLLKTSKTSTGIPVTTIDLGITAGIKKLQHRPNS